MDDANLFAKLNRFLETHTLSNADDDKDDFLEKVSFYIGDNNAVTNKRLILIHIHFINN